MNLVRWKRFTWNLEKSPPPGAATLHSFQIKVAAAEDERAMNEVALNALALDFGWGDFMKSLRGTLAPRIEASLARDPVPALVARHGQRVIAVSLLVTEVDAENHLFSGPCVLAEYRNRGIGTALLHESLAMLKAAGLSQVHGVCKEGSPACKFVYPKFGAKSEAFEYEPTVVV